jgi:hypothetical protein
MPAIYSHYGGGGVSSRGTAIEGSFSAWGGLGKLDRRLGRGETFFPDSDSDRDSDETFQISRKLGLVHVEFFCLLDSQLCFEVIEENSRQSRVCCQAKTTEYFCRPIFKSDALVSVR